MKYRMLLPAAFLALSISSPSNSESLDSTDSTDSTDEQFLQDAALSDGELDSNRGEGAVDIDIDALTINQVEINGANYGNVARGTISGDNVITNGSFAGANGLFDVIQNTGNNVLIQKATIVNITVMD